MNVPSSSSRLRRGYNRAPRGALEVRLDSGLRPSQPPGDLGDRKTLLIAIVARERGRLPALLHTIDRGHRRRRYRSQPTSPPTLNVPRTARAEPCSCTRVTPSPSTPALRVRASPPTSCYWLGHRTCFVGRSGAASRRSSVSDRRLWGANNLAVTVTRPTPPSQPWRSASRLRPSRASRAIVGCRPVLAGRQARS